MLRFTPLIVQDPVFKQEAFRLLIPADWRGGGTVEWRMHPQYPAALSVWAGDPAGAQAVFSYPMVPFVEGVWHLPQGAYYLGNQVCPRPADIRDYLERFVIPRFRREIRNPQVLAVEDMPDWAAASAVLQETRQIGVPASAAAGRIRLSHVLNGRQVHEEFNLVLLNLPMTGLNFWGAEWATSVRAAPDELASVRQIHQTMVTSFRLDPHWFSRNQQVAAMLTQVIQHESALAMQLSAYLTRTNDQVTATIRDAYERRQDAMDRVNDQFSRYIRGVEKYHNPFDGRSVELPSQYDHAWASTAGEYVLSDDPNFDPNRDLQGGDWRLLRPMG